MAQGELLEIADELYAASLPEFTPLRDAKAKELKAQKSRWRRAGQGAARSPRWPPGS